MKHGGNQMQSKLKKLRGKITVLMTIVLLLTFGKLSYAELQLGNMSYGRIATPNLTRTVSRGASFFRGVGGVAFEAIAKGEDGLIVSGLGYNAKATDGRRLEVVLRDVTGKIYKTIGNIYDWQLVPVARFANSPYGSAMTLFGESTNEQVGKEIRDAGGRIINYHKNFEDTLVGLRLFHADILIFQENAADLFKDSNGKYILGAGESGHDINMNKDNFKQIKATMEQERSKGNTYSSYVIGDLDQEVTFRLKNKKLQFTGTPYWWMWDNPKKYKSDVEILQALSSLERLSKIGENFSPMQKMEYLLAEVTIEKFEEEDGDWNALAQRLERYQTIEIPVESNPEFSRVVSQKVIELKGINPIVYANLTTVMHYSALFRHAKQIDAEGYSKFLRLIENVEVTPKVETPNVQYGIVH